MMAGWNVPGLLRYDHQCRDKTYVSNNNDFNNQVIQRIETHNLDSYIICSPVLKTPVLSSFVWNPSVCMPDCHKKRHGWVMSFGPILVSFLIIFRLKSK